MKKRLLIVSDNLGGGGVQRVISLLIQYAPKGYDVSLALTEKKIYYKLRPGTKIYFIHPYKMPLDFLRSLLDLYTVVLRERPSAVMGVKRKIWNLILFLVGVKRIIRVPSYQLYKHKRLREKLPYLLKRKLLYPRASKIIAVSQQIRKFLINEWQINPDKIVVVYNPLDMQLVRNLATEPLNYEEKTLFERKKVIINVARLSKEKGQWHLIRAFKSVSKEVPDARLVILGNGVLKNYLEKLISDLNLRNKVFLLGWRSNPFKYMARSFLFCFPSLWEGFGNAIVEALACGLPVMSADCLSGPREILAPGTRYKVYQLKRPEYAEYGILMPVMDGKFYSVSDPLTWQEEVWAEEIIRCLTHPEKLSKYRAKAISWARDFDAKKIAKRYFEVLLKE